MGSWRSLPSRLEGCGWLLLVCATASACGEAKEASRVELPVVVDGSCLQDVTTDLGYRVHLDTARLAAGDLQFAVAGEIHMAGWLRTLAAWWTPIAQAHPGHYTGGEVTGELPGHFILDWIGESGASLGKGTLLTGLYDSANFTLERAATPAVAADDPLAGHTALLEGTAERMGELVPFVARIDSPENRQIVGIPFEAPIDSNTQAALGVALCTIDPLEKDTLFDGIEFLNLVRDPQGIVQLEETSADRDNQTSYLRLKRTLQTHDHFQLQTLSPGENL